jgi:hypothetical protein
MKRILGPLAVLVLAFLGAIVLGAPAQATPGNDEPETICSTWKARGATGAYPDIDFGGKPDGTEISTSTAKLTKPEGVSPGVEFATFDLGVGPLDQEAHVRVEYATSGGASTSAGAVRMFAYEDKSADTLNDAPDWVKAAETEEGNLLFTVPAGKKIGTLGLVFDASNNTTGAVTFKNLTIGEQPVSFTACPDPEPTTTKPDPEPTTTKPDPGSSSPAAVTCSSFDTKADAQEAYLKDPEGLAHLDSDGDGRACEWTPADGSGGGGLPVTGPSIGIVVMAAVIIIGTGAVLTVMVRRRKVNFTA